MNLARVAPEKALGYAAPSIAGQKLSRFVGRYRQSSDYREKLCSILCACGILAVIYCLTFFSEMEASKCFQFMIMFPVLLLQPGIFVKLWKSSIAFKLTVVYLVYTWVTLHWGVVAEASMFTRFLKRSAYLLIFVSAVYIARPVFVRYWWVALSVFVICVLGVAVGLEHFVFNTGGEDKFTMNFGVLHHNLTAKFVSFLSLLIMGLSWSSKKTGFLLLIFASLFICYLAVLATASRGAILGLVTVFAVVCFAARDRNCLVMLAAAVCAFGGFKAVENHFEAIAPNAQDVEVSVDSFLDRKDSGRLQFWGRLLQRVDSDEYLFGTGYLTYDGCIEHPRWFPHAHGLYMSSFFHGGLVSLGLHVAIVLAVLVKGWQAAKVGKYMVLIFLSYMFIPALVDGKTLIFMDHKYHIDMLLFWSPVAVSISYLNKKEFFVKTKDDTAAC